MKAAGIEMTVEDVERHDPNDTFFEDLVARLQHEFPRVPWSVHDAAIGAAIGQIARRLRDRLAEVLERNGAAP
jgi:hypothetical protein